MAKRKTLDADGIWRPKKIKIEYTDEKLSASTGLGPLCDAFSDSPAYERLKACVPKRSGNSAYDSMQFVMPLMAGFWNDYDCLEDIEKLETKPDLAHRFEGVPSARAIGDYLRDFTPSHFEAVNEFLTKQALLARKALAPDSPLVLDMDSTSHVQSGKQIEGLAVNYKGEICLDSLESFDELGFCYSFRLRSGDTFSSVGAGPEIMRIFSHLPHAEEKYFRGDSAFCNEDVIESCIRRGAFFTITAHGNTNWESKVPEITSWEPWVYSKEEIDESERKKRPLAEVELGGMVYQPGWSDNLRFMIVVKRTRVSEQENLFTKSTGGYRYYGVMTNVNVFNWGRQKVIEHHAKRGNSENFIREKKIHLDLKHFPCLKMNANTGYGLIAMVAYNFLRLVARLDEPTKPHFAKKIREKFIFIPGKVVKHARQFFLKIPKTFKKEVDLMTTGWAGILEAALAMG